MTDYKDNMEVVDIVDLEECAKAGHRPTPARRYRIRIDRDQFTVEQHSITGRELLQLAGKTPVESFAIHQKLRHGQVMEIGLDESVDLTKPGIERFLTMERKVTDGEATAVVQRRLTFHLPEEDREYLDSLGRRWETIEDQGGRWVLIHEHPLPAGFNLKTACFAIRVEGGYPPAKLDMVYLFPALQRVDGRPIPALSTQPLDGETFQRWSRHYEWREGVDSLSSHHLRMVQALEDELRRG
jgi:Prokaryotic E2 family E/Multiubiquitin